jgi:integrase
MRQPLAEPASRQSASLYAAVCLHPVGLGDLDRSGTERLGHTLDAQNRGRASLQRGGNLRAVQLLLGHTKMDSTVRYLGIELEDALEISEGVEM